MQPSDNELKAFINSIPMTVQDRQFKRVVKYLSERYRKSERTAIRWLIHLINGGYNYRHRILVFKRIKSHKHQNFSPVVKCYAAIKQRCQNPSAGSYKYYGGRGIRCRISYSELLDLWVKHKANKMKRPSVDRINPDKSYTKENCRFIELSKNVARRRRNGMGLSPAID